MTPAPPPDAKADDVCRAIGPHHGDPCSGGRIQSPNAQFTRPCSECGGTGRRKSGIMPTSSNEHAAKMKRVRHARKWAESRGWTIIPTAVRFLWAWPDPPGPESHVVAQQLGGAFDSRFDAWDALAEVLWKLGK